MDDRISQLVEDVRSGDRGLQDAAYARLMEMTALPVPWAYEAWGDLVEMLRHPSNRTRAIAAQVLCGLAASDPEERMVEEVGTLVAVTRDERFVTARHCLQSLWKVGAAGERQRLRLLQELDVRFAECAAEKNGTLIRYDITEALKRIHQETGDERMRDAALAWIDREADPKYRKKYASVWKGA